MPLTDVKIRQTKAAFKRIKLTDSNGPYIEVKPIGMKLWRYRYRFVGKENVFTIEEYPEATLQPARTARDNSVHPSHARRID